ncbi:hypothetical protein GCM10008904_00150 [Paraclostridium ghonii]|uniref:Uncharacterized protein n=1 Tax=Paraclostridium ghonii TaxID=29358 RepID=A0ABU0MYA4_9FIRM|nr:hypothetical protein [Paeniclostridium ghonii]MDQ0555880.1 hypothetical protein [Paeniclostridium ghonii]
MIDKSYINKFGSLRYDNFSHGEKVDTTPLFKDYVDIIDMQFLESLVKSKAFSPFLYDLCYYIEMIHRIDFNSKYYFHSLSPKARNLNTIKVILIYNNFFYAYNAIKDQVEIYKQDRFIGVDPEKTYILLLNDNRKLQEVYGQFYKMLSRLNTGHALYNLEHVLKKNKINYVEIKDKNIEILPNTSFIDIPYVVELPQLKLDIENSMNSEEDSKKDLFLKRSSSQNIISDSIVISLLSKEKSNDLIKEIIKINNRESIEIILYLDNLEGIESGYYKIANSCIEKVNFSEKTDYTKLLKEYQEFTNLTGLNFWLFFYNSEENINEKYDEWFIRLGYISQEISILATKYNLGSRGMKNYNDLYIKEKFELNENSLIGYSLVLFPYSNTGHSVAL